MSHNEELIARYYDMVWRICYTRLWRYNRASVDDAAQNVFLGYCRAAPRLRDENAERAYFIRAAINASNDIYRELRRDHACCTDLDVAETLSAPHTDQPDCDRMAIWDALADLSPPYRAVIELCCINGCSSSEAAAVLGISDTAVRMRLTRARKQLRYILVKGGMMDGKEEFDV